jgi:hypothetical protein
MMPLSLRLSRFFFLRERPYNPTPQTAVGSMQARAWHDYYAGIMQHFATLSGGKIRRRARSSVGGNFVMWYPAAPALGRPEVEKVRATGAAIDNEHYRKTERHKMTIS